MIITPKLTLEAYHELPMPSASVLSEAFRSIAHLNVYLENKKKKSAGYDLGTFVHEFIENKLELPPQYERVADYYVRATGKAVAGDPKLDENGNPIFHFDCTTDPTRSLTPKESVAATEVMAALQHWVGLRNIVNNEGVIFEQSMTGIVDGVEVKARPDIIVVSNNEVNVYEIKTTKADQTSADAFSRDAFAYNYDLQAYLEKEITQQNYPDKVVHIHFLAIGTEVPVGMVDYVVPTWFMETGARKTKTALAVWNMRDMSKQTYYVKTDELSMSYAAANFMAQEGIES